MGFMRSLYAGVSGLKNHQIMMDVTGNNISNVNTAGFKAGRVVFSETFAQTLRGTTAPISNVGGTNPMQIGLGTSLQQIDTLFAQGNIETTGQTTDMAIQGEGFFVVKQGDKRYYTRAGAFHFDADGSFINPGNGAILQGLMADKTGTIPVAAKVESIILPYGQKSPAKATTSISYTGNLDASDVPKGTILDTEKLYSIDDGTSDLSGMFISNLPTNGNDSRSITAMISESTTVSLTIDDGQGNANSVRTQSFTYNSTDPSTNNGSFNSLNDLIAELNNSNFDNGTGTGTNLAFAMATNATANTGGFLQIANVTDEMTVTFESSNPSLNLALASLNRTGTVGAGAPAPIAAYTTSYRFHHIAKGTDTLLSLVDKQGNSLGLAADDVLTVAGKVGGTSIDNGGTPAASPQIIVAPTGAVPTPGGGGVATTYQEFIDNVERFFNITNDDGVMIDTDGSMKINGDGGLIKELSAMEITGNDAGGTNPARLSVFNGIYDSSSGNYTTKQNATDVKHAASISTFDSLGNEHVVTITYKKNVEIPNEWFWEAAVTEPGLILGGGTGRVSFDTNGVLSSFEYDAGASSLQIDPGKGEAEVMNLTLNFGELGDINGITQFARTSDTVASSQDGYTMGVLERLNVERHGVITGTFTNGISQTMARLVLSTFNNPGGLLRAKDGMFETTANSGTAIIGLAQESVNAEVIAGALEQSNVDLTEEFTRLIIAQRGFQAASKVISTSDELLQEINALKR